jgi:hypothetical protein
VRFSERVSLSGRDSLLVRAFQNIETAVTIGSVTLLGYPVGCGGVTRWTLQKTPLGCLFLGYLMQRSELALQASYDTHLHWSISFHSSLNYLTDIRLRVRSVGEEKTRVWLWFARPTQSFCHMVISGSQAAWNGCLSCRKLCSCCDGTSMSIGYCQMMCILCQHLGLAMHMTNQIQT